MRPILLGCFALLLLAGPAMAQSPNQGANPAEQFVSNDIRTGLGILSDASLNAGARADHFQTFLLGATDLDRIALFTLGGAAATPAQRAAFTAAFRAYATAVYRSYFQNYSGQSLAVTGSRVNAPGDTIVHTRLTDGANPLAVDFRVRTDGAKPLVLDVGIAGVWLALTQRDDFAAYLAHNHGDVGALTSHLVQVAKSYH